jgi:hypothetical protein
MERMNEPDAVLTSLGAYVLGALSPTERAEVGEHLRGCSGCREELAGLADLPGLLGSLDQTDLEHLKDGEPEPDRQLLERTLLELTRRRQAQRRRSSLLTAAAALVVVATTVTALLAVRSTPSDHSASALGPSVSAANTTARVHAEVRLTQQPWGTALHLVLRGVPPGAHCQLLAVLANGQRQTAGSWQASYEGAAVIDAAADAPLNRLAGVEVVTDRGVRLVSIPLSSG